MSPTHNSFYPSATVNLADAALAELRRGQHGAIRAMQGWALRGEPQRSGLVALPTGYGKSELVALAPYAFAATRTLVVAPSRIIRDQLAARIRDRSHLVRAKIVSADPAPKVLARKKVLSSAADWRKLEAYDVVVAHPSSVSPAIPTVAVPHDPHLFDLLLFDEAHHLGANTWRRLVETFPEATVLGFTATPFRRDRRSLEETIIFEYPLARAVEEGFFAPITYRQVTAGATRAERDRAVANAAIKEVALRESNYGPAARLLVRSDTIERAARLVELYRELSNGTVVLECITHKTGSRDYQLAMTRLHSATSAGVSFVGVLGEGFDLPSLKIAAYHAAHRSLPATVQFAGRVARGAPTGEEAVLIAAEDDHPQVVRALHQDNERWDLLIPGLAEQLRTVPTRTWSSVESDDDEMIEAFTAENARFFRLADVWQVDEPLDLGEAVARITDVEFSAGVVGADHITDSAWCVKSLVAPTVWAGLFQRSRPVRWLARTPANYIECDTMIVAAIPSASGGQWLLVRSTLGSGLTDRVLTLFCGAKPKVPQKSAIARYGQWSTARVTSLGKRSVHPVVAGMQSYETGAGEDVAAAVTTDDRNTKEAGHIIAIHGSGPASRQLGIAVNRRRLWETGYASLPDYAAWATRVALALDSGVDVGELAGLRIGGGTLPPDAKPIGAVLDPHPSRWDLQYIDANSVTHSLADAELDVARPQNSGPVDLTFTTPQSQQPFLTLTFAPDGQPGPAAGFIERFGNQVQCHRWFELHPPQLFFADGSVLTGPGGYLAPIPNFAQVSFPIAAGPTNLRTETRLGARNRVITVDRAIAQLPEKPVGAQTARLKALRAIKPTTTVLTSLFDFIVKSSRVAQADFIFCDDDAGEIADFIVGWTSHKHLAAPALLLVHAKAASSSRRTALRKAAADSGTGTTLNDAQEVAQQALRSIEFLNLSPVQMVKRLEARSEAHPARWIRGAQADAERILENTRRANEIRVVHPGLNYTQLTGAQGERVRTLFGSIRTRAQASLAELTLVVRHI
jgi:superfamily II DNA or RNA helicase